MARPHRAPKVLCFRQRCRSRWRLHRELDALAGDKKFLADLGDAIASIATKYIDELPAEKRPTLRSNAAIASSPPADADVELYFSRKEEQDRELLSQFEAAVMHELGRAESGSSSDLGTDHLGRAAFEFSTKIRTISDASNLEGVAKAATLYLDEFEAELDGSAPSYDIAQTQRMRALMPVAFENPGPIMRSSGMRAIHTRNDFHYNILQNERFDRMIYDVSRRIFNFAYYVGPPPPATPLDHYPIFEAAACYVALCWPKWDAHSRWQDQGVFQFKQRSADEWSPTSFAIKFDLVQFR